MKKQESATQVATNQVFNLNENSVRVQIINDEPWFVAKDVCDSICLENSRKATAKLDDDEKRVSLIVTPSGEQQMTIVNESGLYNLIFQSRKPEAKAFKKWVTSEVLPSIRKNGTYSNPKPTLQLPEQKHTCSGPTNARQYLEPGDITLTAIKFGVEESYVNDIMDGKCFDIKIMRFLFNQALENREVLYNISKGLFNGMGI